MIWRPNSDACVAGALPIGELTDTQLARGVVKLRRRMDRADALFAELTLAAHQRGACTVDSYKSTKSWLKWKTGMHPGHVQRAIDTASVTELLPEIGAGWRDGTISSAAVETIAAARVGGHDEKLQALEPEFLDLALRGDHPSQRTRRRNHHHRIERVHGPTQRR